ncbi:MAG TPA: hypothetical protein VGD33_11130 [Chitinophagaceae bacterium]
MEDKFSPQESLLLIQSMIERTKTNISENRFYFLVWGWLTFSAILLQFFLKVVMDYKHHYIVWLLMIIGIVLTIWKSRQEDKEQGYRTYVGDSMGYLWLGIGISFFVLSIIITFSIGWFKAWPFFILFYGMGTFISGKLIQFTPSIVGGIICWILAPIAIFVHYDYQLLIAAAAILCSYIIPGYMIKPETNTR